MSVTFGEPISLEAFPEPLQTKAKELAASGNTVYDQFDIQSRLGVNKRALLITVYDVHACVNLVPEKNFIEILDAAGQMVPTVGSLITGLDGANLSLLDEIRELETIRFHICLNRNKGEYWLRKQRLNSLGCWVEGQSTFMGWTVLSDSQMEIHACCTVIREMKEKYRLTQGDCVEFSKNFCAPIAMIENCMEKEEVTSILSKLMALSSDTPMSMRGSEKKSRRVYIKGFSAAYSYFLSFRPQRLIIGFVTFLILVVAIGYGYWILNSYIDLSYT